MAVCAFGIHPFQVRINHLVVFGYQVPTRFDLPGSGSDLCSEDLSCGERLSLSHELGLSRRQVSSDILREVFWLKEAAPIRSLTHGPPPFGKIPPLSTS